MKFRTSAQVDRPVFVIGTGRSGTTLLFSLLAFNPELAWFSNFDERFPDWPGIGALARVHDLPGSQRLLNRRSRFVPRPLESYATLNRCTRGLFSERRDLDAGDATPEIAARFRVRVRRQLALQARRRFIAKYTGVPRIGFVDAVFPDARFVEVARDGRAVAASLLHAPWWTGDLASWRYGPFPRDYAGEYEAGGRHPAVLAAIAWKHLTTLHELAAARLGPERHRRVGYAALVHDPVGVLRELCDFCELRWRADFERHLRAWPIFDANVTWARALSVEDRARIERSISIVPANSQ